MPELYTLNEGEKKLSELHKNWFGASIIITLGVMFFAVFIGLFVLALDTPSFINADGAFANIFKLLFILFGYFMMIFIFIAWLDYYLDMVIVTTERVISVDQNALFSRKVSELMMENIQDVTSHTPGFFGTIFNYGTVTIQTAGERENFIIHNITHPHWVAQKISQARRDYLSRKTLAQAEGFKGALRESADEEKKKIGEMLLEENLISQQQLAAALTAQKKQGGRLGTHLVDLGYINGNTLNEALSRQQCCASVDLARYNIDPQIIKIIPRSLAYKLMVVPISKNNHTLTVAMVDPTDAYALSKIEEATGCEVMPVISAEKFITEALEKYYPQVISQGRVVDEKDGMFWQGGEEMPEEVLQALEEIEDEPTA